MTFGQGAARPLHAARGQRGDAGDERGHLHQDAVRPRQGPGAGYETVTVNYVLVVGPGVPVRTVPQLVAYAKANPGKLSYGSSGSGSAQHMAAELYKAQTGINITHLPYKGTGALSATSSRATSRWRLRTRPS